MAAGRGGDTASMVLCLFLKKKKKKKKGRAVTGWQGKNKPQNRTVCAPDVSGGAAPRRSGQGLQHQVRQELLSAQLIVLLVHVHQQLDSFVAHGLLQGVCDEDTFERLQ